MSSVVENVVSLGNSTTLSLSADESFVGVAENVLSFQEIDVTTVGTPMMAPGVLYFEFSPDGVNWDVSTPTTLTGPSPIPLILRVVLPFFRIRYVNGDVALTTLRISTLFHRSPSLPAPLTKFLNQEILPLDPVLTSRAVIAAQTLSGSYENASLDDNGALIVASSKSSTHSTNFVTASLTSQIILNKNPDRIGAVFSNQWSLNSTSAGNAYLSIGTTASTSSFLVVIAPGSVYSLDFNTTEAFSVIYDAATGSLMFTEGS